MLINFFFRFNIIKNKIIKSLIICILNFKSLKTNKMFRFLNCHFEYKFKILRHLKQNRYMNTNLKIKKN